MNSLWILGIATFFWLMETAYFGWNITPKSEAELICDGLVALMCCLALLAPR